MHKFRLELFCKIVGIGSASGLIFQNNSLYMISDNSNVLYTYDISSKNLSKAELSQARPLENIPKTYKPDFEAMTMSGNYLYLFGSGSTDKRNTAQKVDIASTNVSKHDMAELYDAMQSFGQIDKANFNIEAAVNDGADWYFFNRGNGPKGQNAIFTLSGDVFGQEYQMLHNEFKLPKINGAPSSFTDAMKVKSKLYFLAAAEKSNSTYHDGEVAGTLIGCIDIDSMEIDWTETISTKNKFEGITLYAEDNKTLTFLLCEDTDSDVNASEIYKLTIER
jgi:hypothetical protein